MFFQIIFKIKRGCILRMHFWLKCKNICFVNYRVHFIILGIYKISWWDISYKVFPPIKVNKFILQNFFYQCRTSKQTGITVPVFKKDHGFQMWVSIRIPESFGQILISDLHLESFDSVAQVGTWLAASTRFPTCWGCYSRGHTWKTMN